MKDEGLSRGATLRRSDSMRAGLTLIEILAVVVIVAVVAVLIVPRLVGQSDEAKKNACYVNKGNIEVQAQLWYRNKGSWPANPLANSLGGDAAYFPTPLPVCPVDGTAYELDAVTHRVTGHNHD